VAAVVKIVSHPLSWPSVRDGTRGLAVPVVVRGRRTVLGREPVRSASENCSFQPKAPAQLLFFRFLCVNGHKSHGPSVLHEGLQ